MESRLTDHELRVERGGFTTLPDSVWQHGLSARAIGVLVLMLSKPPGWRFSTERLALEVREGRDAVRAAVTELEEAGFVSRRQQAGENGVWVTVVKVAPTAKWAVTNTGKSGVGGSGVGGSGASTKTETPDREPQELRSSVAARRRQAEEIAEATIKERPATSVRRGKPLKRRSLEVVKDRDKYRPAEVTGGDDVPKRETTPTYQLTQRFKRLCRERGAKPGSYRIVGLNTAFKRFLDEGASVAAIEQAMDEFFDDPARLHRTGGVPWEDFVYSLPRHLDMAAITASAASASTEDWLGLKRPAGAGAMSDEETRKWLGL